MMMMKRSGNVKQRISFHLNREIFCFDGNSLEKKWSETKYEANNVIVLKQCRISLLFVFRKREFDVMSFVRNELINKNSFKKRKNNKKEREKLRREWSQNCVCLIKNVLNWVPQCETRQLLGLNKLPRHSSFESNGFGIPN